MSQITMMSGNCLVTPKVIVGLYVNSQVYERTAAHNVKLFIKHQATIDRFICIAQLTEIYV